MSKTIIINTPKDLRSIGPGNPCFIIAEMSANHHQNYDEAVRIVKAAAESGADAIKLQTYTPDTITIDSRKSWFLSRTDDNPESWKGQSLYDLYKKAYTPWEWHSSLKTLAESLGLVFFSTPYDATAVDFLETLNVPMYKIASYECTHIPLLKKIAATKKPIIMSVGFASKEEINFSVDNLRKAGVENLILLHCSTSYSAEAIPEDSNLATIKDIANSFGVVAGFSDNNNGIEVPVTAVSLGAAVIEKHFAPVNSEALDARFSLTPDSFKDMVEAIRSYESTGQSSYLLAEAIGSVHYGPNNASEAGNMRYRQSLFVVADIKSGEVLTTDNVHCIRPSDGLPTRYYEEVIGKKAAKDIERGTPLSWDLIIK
jgi:pseudaminic acid synthase